MADASDLLDDIVGQFTNFATETGKSLAQSAGDLATYTAERAQHLAGIYSEPGFREAVIAERDNVALKAGIAAVDEADALDQRFLGLIDGILSTASGALVKLTTGLG